MIIKYSVKLESPAMTGKDGVVGKDTDIITKLDSDGFPYFSGSHIKGIVKEKFGIFSKALGLKLNVEKYFGEKGDTDINLRFSSLTLKNKEEYLDYKEFLIEDRCSIKIDKETKTTAEGSLFSYEFIRKDMEFKGDIEIFQPLKIEELKLLKASLERVETIGGLKSRGLGKVKVTVDKVIENKEDKYKELNLKNFKKYRYTLTPMEDLILKNQEIGNEISTINYIQGGTLRGALISYIDKNYKVNVETLIKELKVSQGLPENYFIAPLSVLQSKYPVEKNQMKRVNSLLSETSPKELSKKDIKFERFGSPIVNDKYEKLVINKKTEINIAIDSLSGTSQEGQIFNKEILLAKGIKFSGEIYLTEDIVKNIDEKSIFIGKNKSKGFGKCLISFESISEEKDSININKLESLSKRIGQDKKYFTIDFISDMILPFSDTVSIGDQVRELLCLDEVKWEESKSFINIISIEGYNQLNKIRKGSEFAISKGGVLTFSTEKFSDHLVKKLAVLEEKGIGCRKSEGFGTIEISSKKHQEVK